MDQKGKLCNFISTLNAASHLLTSHYVHHIFRMLRVQHCGIHIEFPCSDATPAWRERKTHLTTKQECERSPPLQIPPRTFPTPRSSLHIAPCHIRSSAHAQLWLVSVSLSHTTSSLVSPRDKEKNNRSSVMLRDIARRLFPQDVCHTVLLAGKVASSRNDDALLNGA